MKKILGLGIAFLILTGFYTASSANKNADMDLLLLPYQKVIDNLSEDLGVPFYIETKNKERFYNNVKDITPEQFEKMLIEEYKESEADIINDKSYVTDDAPYDIQGPNIPNHNGSVILTPLEENS